VRLRLAFQYFGWKIRVMHPCAPPPPTERAQPLNGIVVMQHHAPAAVKQPTNIREESPSRYDELLSSLQSRALVTLPVLAWVHIACTRGLPDALLVASALFRLRHPTV
jgi:hypothetical protein